jgi:hypothetical protein
MELLSSKKAMSFLGAVLAVCVLAAPSPASASSWGVVGTTHTLNSANLGFVVNAQILGTFTWLCNASQLHVDVASAAALRVTGATFSNCTASGPGVGDCTLTATPTRLPWTATGTTTSNVQIHGLSVDLRFETKPGGVAGSCAYHNQDMTWTGTVNGGTWTGEQHEFTFHRAPGTVMHFLIGGLPFTGPTTVLGTFRDPSQSLTLT